MNVLTHEEMTQDDVNLYWHYRKHGINKAFFLRYFEKLKRARTTIEAFNDTNEEYYDLFGEHKYSCVRSFRIRLKIYLDT